MRATLPELPELRARRFVEAYGLSEYDAAVLTATREEADAYEAVVGSDVPAKLAANWQMGDVARLANAQHLPVWRSGLGLEGLIALLRLVDTGEISGKVAKELLDELYAAGGDPAALVRERGLGRVSDESALAGLVDEAIAANPQAVADFRGGKEAALQRIVGYVMKATRGAADAQVVNKLLREHLADG